MVKYRTKGSWWSEELECEISAFASIMVIEEDDGISTGIIDKNGDEFLRYHKIKIGFTNGN